MNHDTRGQKRVQFDFTIRFSNGGSLHGEGFRLDIPDDGISNERLADYLVEDMRLLMVGAVDIRNKAIITEPHKRVARPQARSTKEDGDQDEV